MDKQTLLHLKRKGFSDAKIAALKGVSEKEIRQLRHALGIRPVYKRVDTCAGEFEAKASYMYSTYEELFYGGGDGHNYSCEADVSADKKIVILGSGPNRIGQGIEFDYACVHAALSLKGDGDKASFEVIMVNCNPETVSTDYDISDRLYFEPLTAEHVLEILHKESLSGELVGVVVQFGGQTPLKLAKAVEEAGYKIIGTSVSSIDLAEDRELFKQLLQNLQLKQPANDICRTEAEAMEKAARLGFPVVVRPSFVLGGRAMAIIYSAEQLKNYMKELISHFGDGPILLDSYLSGAIEVDVDALSDGRDVYVAGVMEHIEEAGIHSGDSACVLPPYSLSAEIVAELERQTVELAKALKVIGLINIQYAIKDNEIYVLEVNPRASRTAPFVAKATGVPVAKIAARLMVGDSLASFNLKQSDKKHISVKEAVFPFARFSGVDVILGPEMKSTGEAMGMDDSFGLAFAKAEVGAFTNPPMSGCVFVSVKESDKPLMVEVAEKLIGLGFQIIATRGTAAFLKDCGLTVSVINKVREGRPHIVDMMKDGMVNLVLNTTEGQSSVADSFSIRRTALLRKIPYVTTIAGAKAMALAIEAMKSSGGFKVKSLQEYLA